jgi:hypothetical protein
VEHREVGGERLQVHRPAHVQGAHEPLGVPYGQRRESRRERVRVDERDAFLGEELDVTEQRGREVGHGREVSLAD